MLKEQDSSYHNYIIRKFALSITVENVQLNYYSEKVLEISVRTAYFNNVDNRKKEF